MRRVTAREEAACRIQAACRGGAGRQIAALRKRQREQVHARAAVRLQAMHRGGASRQQLRRRHDAASRLACVHVETQG